MKPDIPCANHPDSEGFFQCRYCGENFCDRCCRRIERDFHLCAKAECLRAYQAEAGGPSWPCPYCGTENPPFTGLCFFCGRKKIPDPAGKDPDAPVTVAKFRTVNEANLARTKLENHGIEAFVADEAIGAIYDLGSGFLGGVRLQASRRDADKAAEILLPNGSEGVSGLGPEPAGACRYCGDILNQEDAGNEAGPLHCRKPGCLQAYQTEMESLTRICPACGTSAVHPGGFCANCGVRLPGIESDQEPGNNPFQPVPMNEKWDFRWALLLWLLLHTLKFTPAAVYSGIDFWRGVLPDPVLVHGIFDFVDLLCLFLILRWTQGFLGLPWKEALKFLGFKRPDPRQLLAGIILLIPLLTGFLLSFQGYQKEGALIGLKTQWAREFIGYLLGAGLLEETFYRGFLFRFLRRGRPFLTAAILSSGLWALAHLAHLMPTYGPEHETFAETSYLIFGVFMDGIVASFLFERGGNNIWGWMLVHLVFDNCYLIEATGSDFYISSIPKNEVEAGHWISVLLAVPVTLWVLPKREGDGHPENHGDKFRGNELSGKWSPYFRPVVLALAGVMSVFLITAQGDSESANRNHWRQYMDGHPRYADGYRKWAYDLWTYEEDSEAEEKCRAALAIDPKNYKAWLLWGKILRGQRNYEDAVGKFEKAADCAPRNAAIYLWWGYVLEYLDEREDAIGKYRTVLSLNPDEVYFTDYARYRIDRLRGKWPLDSLNRPASY